MKNPKKSQLKLLMVKNNSKITKTEGIQKKIHTKQFTFMNSEDFKGMGKNKYLIVKQKQKRKRVPNQFQIQETLYSLKGDNLTILNIKKCLNLLMTHKSLH